MVLEIDVVVYEVDDGKEEVGVGEGGEDIMEGSEMVVGNGFGDGVGEGGEN